MANINGLNAHERVARRLVKKCANELIGGYLCQLQDYRKEDKEWQDADKVLSNKDWLEEMIYDDVMASDKGYMKHIRFAGEAFIRAMIKIEVFGIDEERKAYGLI